MQEPTMDNIMDNFWGYPEHKRNLAVKILTKACGEANFEDPDYDDEQIRVTVCLYPDFTKDEKSEVFQRLQKLAVSEKAPLFLKSFVADPENIPS